jgi:glycosyltransferase involved in cell wall biosynthesis
MSRPHVSVVVPAYGCEECLEELHRRLVLALEGLNVTFEIILVNDASPLADWTVIEKLAKSDARVRGVNLARNFGQHYALSAGLDIAEGDWIVVMDCDLQDRPEEIARFYAHVKSSAYQGVFGRRTRRQHGWSKRVTSRIFYALFGYLVGMKIDPTVGNYSMISRQVVLNYRRFRERNRNYGLNVHWMGFDLAYVDVQHDARHKGESTYGYGALLRFAIETVLFQSTKPLLLSINLGLATALLALFYGVYLIVRAYAWAVPVPGWTSVMVSLYFLAGITFVILGVIGLYVGAVFVEVKGRPLYIVKQTTGEDAKKSEPLG